MDYDPYSDSPDEDVQPFFYSHPATPGLDNFAEGTSQSTGVFYGPGYYRTPSPYSIGPYYIPPGYTQGVTMNQNVYTMYHNES